MKIYFASWLTDATLGISLTRKKANRRLLSFHFIRTQGGTKELLNRYSVTGRANVRKEKE
jgi:hypothetical protein